MSGNDSVRDRIATLLRGYPSLNEHEMAELHHLFEHVATALDLGLLASDPDIALQFRTYRAKHHNRFKPRDIGKVLMFVGVVVAVIGGIVLLMPR